MIRRTCSVALNSVRLHRDPVRYFRGQGVEIDDDVEIFGANLFMFGSEPYLVSIGKGVTISHGVDFITHDGGMRVARLEHPGAYFYRRIQVEDHCFLGARCTLLPGARVGRGSVIGSGSVVSGEIPAGVVAAGVPAKPVKPIQQYIEEKMEMWIDTRGLTWERKRELLLRSLPK